MNSEIIKFVGKRRGNEWFFLSPINIYLRTKPFVVEIANVVVDEESRGKGVFTEFLNSLLCVTTKSILVENVFNERLGKYLVRHGFASNNLEVPSYKLSRLV